MNTEKLLEMIIKDMQSIQQSDNKESRTWEIMRKYQELIVLVNPHSEYRIDDND